MTHSKSVAGWLLGSAALLAVAVPSFAQAPRAEPTPPPATVTPPPASTPAPATDADTARDQAMQTRRNDRKAFMEARIAALRAGLQLTPQQEPMWSPVETALRDLGAARQSLHRRGDQQSDPTARLKQRGATLIAMGQAMGKLADATGPLLGALSPEQKGRLPVLLSGVGPHRIVTQAFAIGRGDHDAMEDGGRERRRGLFADRDGQDGRESRGGEDWHRHPGMSEREGRADRGYGLDESGFDRQDGPRHHFHRGDERDDDRG